MTEKRTEDIKVSIITVVYNAANTIGRTIESVLNQTYPNIEYIIVDGDSNDGTKDIIGKYAENIDRYISEPDEGLYYAMNKGISIASGNIIGLLNSDDWYEPETVKIVVDKFEETECDIVHGDLRMWSGQNNKIMPHKPIEEIWYEIVVWHPTAFVKADAYRKFGQFNTKYTIAADTDLMLRFYSEGCKFEYIKSVITNFSQGGISERKRDLAVEEANMAYMSYAELVPDKEALIKSCEYRMGLRFLEKRCRSNPDYVLDIIESKVGSQLVAIYGGGVWGKRIEKLLVRNNVTIRYHIDRKNDGQNDIDIPPEYEMENGIAVIVAIEKTDYEVIQNIERYRERGLLVITLEDIVNCMKLKEEKNG